MKALLFLTLALPCLVSCSATGHEHGNPPDSIVEASSLYRDKDGRDHVHYTSHRIYSPRKGP